MSELSPATSVADVLLVDNFTPGCMDLTNSEGAAPVPSPTEEIDKFFPPLSLLRLAVMTVLSLGLFELQWFYRHWKAVKGTTRPKISPLTRTLLAYFCCYTLFSDIRDRSISLGLKTSFPPWILTLAYVGTSVGTSLVVFWSPRSPFLLYFVPVLPLLAVQAEVNRQWVATHGRRKPASWRITWWQWTLYALWGAMAAGLWLSPLLLRLFQFWSD
jgi:hypothetical protein